MSDLVGNPEDRFSHNEARISLATRKPVFMVSKQKKHNLVYAATRTRTWLYIYGELSKERTTKALTRMLEYTGWSASLLFACHKADFLVSESHLFWYLTRKHNFTSVMGILIECTSDIV